MLEIKKGNNKFYIGEEEAHPIAQITYIYSDEKLIIEHTIVSETMSGQGIGKQLVERMVDFAREENVKIIPICEFAKKTISENDTFRDVLADKFIIM